MGRRRPLTTHTTASFTNPPNIVTEHTTCFPMCERASASSTTTSLCRKIPYPERTTHHSSCLRPVVRTRSVRARVTHSLPKLTNKSSALYGILVRKQSCHAMHPGFGIKLDRPNANTSTRELILSSPFLRTRVRASIKKRPSLAVSGNYLLVL